jgi:hypothetical protein
MLTNAESKAQLPEVIIDCSGVALKMNEFFEERLSLEEWANIRTGSKALSTIAQ